MKEGDNLYKLVHLLNKSEKRYLKLYASKYKQPKIKNSLLLFDAINKQQKYNESKLKNALEKSILIRNFPYEKNQLQSLILRALADYHQEDTATNLLHTLLKQINLLKNKGHYKLANKLLFKAYKLARLNESFDFLHQIICLQIALNIDSLGYLTENSWEYLSEELLEVDKKIFLESQYYSLFLKAYQFDLQGNNTAPKTFFNDLFKDTLLKDETQAVTFKSKRFLYMTKSTYYKSISDWENLLLYANKLKELFEKNGHFLKNQFGKYLRHCINYVSVLLLANRVEAAEIAYKKLARFAKKNAAYFDEMLLTSFEFNLKKLRFSIYDCKFLYEKIYEENQKVASTVSVHTGMQTVGYDFLILIKACISLEKYEEVLNLCNQYLQNKKKNTVENITFFVKVFEWMAHYELGNQSKLTSQVNSLYFYSRQKNIDGTYAEVIVSLFRKLSTIKKTENATVIFQKYLTKFEQLPDKNHKTKGILLAWLYSHIKHKPIKTMLKEMRLNSKF